MKSVEVYVAMHEISLHISTFVSEQTGLHVSAIIKSPKNIVNCDIASPT